MRTMGCFVVNEHANGRRGELVHSEDANGQLLHSRREVLTSATYGVGAMLLFRRSVASAAAATSHTSKGQAAGKAVALASRGQPRSVCAGRACLLVVGVGDDDDPVSWMRSGHSHWLEHRLARPAPGEPDVWGVAAHGNQFVAVGSMLQQNATKVVADRSVPGEQSTVTFSARRRRPTIWWTRDGTRWSGRILDDLDEPHAQLVSVSCNSTLLVAVGSTLDVDGVQGSGALVLASDDHGRTWRRGEIARADATLAEGSLTGIARVGDQWLATSSDIEGGAVWTSEDGLRWSSIPTSAKQFRGLTLQGIGVWRNQVYVAGTALATHRPRYFVSSDGCRTWRRLRPGPRALTGSDVTVNDLTVVPGGVVVVGTRSGVPVIEGGAADVGH
jgi:hypothetical protein